MCRTRRVLACSTFVCALAALPASARKIENWSYDRLFKESDLVVIATAESTKDAADRFKDKNWPVEFLGQQTTFEVLQVVKGKESKNKIGVLHFRLPNAPNGRRILIESGPMLVEFRTTSFESQREDAKVEIAKVEYLLFLKKNSDGRYEPVSGRIDPALSVRALFGPTLIADLKPKGSTK